MLKLKVAAVNAANQYAADLYAVAAEAFRPLVGKKILKADNSLMEKFKKLLPTLPYGPRLSVWQYHSEYNLVFMIRTREDEFDGEGRSVASASYERAVYVGRVKEGVLTHFMDAPADRSDWTAEEVQERQETIRKAEAAVHEARSTIIPFLR
jgi:hypothetical protein